MRKNLWIPASALCLFALPSVVSAQIDFSVRSAVIVESFSFDPGVGFESLREISIPIVAQFDVGPRGRMVLSTGYASLRGTGADGVADVTLDGVLDTEARLSWEIMPRRLSLLVTGVLPSGEASLDPGQLPVIGLLANEALDLSTLRFGSGGAFGGGFVGALPAGPMAVGVAATFRQERSYDPLAGSATQLSPGAELRLRVGAEGPVARTGYLRVAGILSRRAEDELGGIPQGTSGTQWTGYAAYEHGLRTSSVILYVFDRFRTAPRLEGTAFGPTVLPRSNTFAVGGRWDVTVRQGDRLSPKVEFRVTKAAPSPLTDAMETLGNSFRAGMEYRTRLSPRAALVAQAEGLFGEVGDLQQPTLIGMSGFRGGIHLEVTR